MRRSFTLGDLAKSACAALNQDILLTSKVRAVKKPDPTGLQSMIEVLDRLHIPYVREHRFHEHRKWRFDLAIPIFKIAAEYEGIVSKHSRHTNIVGYSKDAEKYNSAQALGWTVLRYTALNHSDFESDLLQLISQLKSE